MELWARLEKELNRCGKNWRWLSKISSVPESTLSRWRDGNKYPSVEKVLKMAEHLDVSIKWLLTGQEEGGITDEERDILESFRSLPLDYKEEVIAFIHFKIDHAKKTVASFNSSEANA